ncbi:MAG: bifunctional D-glycero-beta-D-manno-heptose-7-phosphate kinase/D-glycero-beta-D-manno-heptose 1-phosphate adenylyltransferase HldE [Gammaproteobacteria bacterium]|nr:bifunctional D-glycero-beta-D-manno-heptose-7-phosphate kinase/D-glycero-beta-D-manno-heptose 1-phosphate adenylyltransferase HldE [Gammaproteobacteria bacterium]MDH5801750.1 bifunctional D-glycero-beta-D-manno-heptose-7-phosphate kinase/D-glycero-beta-D-manno-heptose 1-phosphate adenylyltransferase HldE [Gammaproteobacteria bacterium]
MKPNIPEFTTAKVLVVGDLMLDRYWHGNTSRISPEAPVPVVHVGEIEERPGGAGNVALNICRLGAQASVIGLTGDDDAATSLQTKLTASGVHCELERLAGYATVTKLRIVSRHQQLIRLDFEDGFCGFDSQVLLQRFRAMLPQFKVVVLSDYGKGSLVGVQELIKEARAAGKTVIIDPKGKDFSKYRGASVLTPNLSEFETIVGVCANDVELEQKGQALLHQLDLEALLVTRSEKGMSLIRRDQPAVHIPTQAREVFDVTGAGDTVISVLAASLAAEREMEEAMALANLAAGVVVGKLGTATVSVPELRHALREQDEIQRGVVTEELLVELVEEARAHGETIVMTNGCFDILHAGHVTYLEQARQLGDRLIVAVNDDASVKRLKGEERPVNTMERRMRLLGALQCVDWVVPFYEDTPTRVICRVLPDLLVKGGDNDPNNIPGGDCVRRAGGRVEVMTYVDKVSTTGLISEIRRSDSAAKTSNKSGAANKNKPDEN